MSAKNYYQKLFEIAESQAGYFSSKQAEKVGYSRPNLLYQTERGKFARIASGIYRINLFPNSPYEDLFIALLKSGDRAVVSHDSALSVYDLSDSLPGEIHITVPRTSSRRRKGIKYHTKSITDNEITVYQGLKVTTVPRTIIDLIGSGYDPIQLKKAIIEACNLGFTTEEKLLLRAEKKSASIQKKMNLYLTKQI
ncbi:MAG: type IV toxin-antitoxin system AbiEi family antitoxin domain-containing protein [Pelolinea sp.]|nr:type IV toxin-antitoxin system AbiEi family antitoxin domain-containing protein [Pelolinea sp.]